VVTAEAVYVVDRSGGVYALDDEGEERWTTSVDDAIKSSPAVYDDTLYFGSDEGRLYAVGVDGERLWDERIGAASGPLSRGTAAIITPPAVVDGRVYVADVEGYVHARDAATGATAWRVDTGGAVYGKPAVRDGAVFVGNDDGLLAAYGVDGERHWSSGAGREITTTPVAGAESWYVVDGNGVVHRLDPSQGGAEVGTFASGSGNPVSPTVGDGRVFLGSRTGTVQAVDGDLSGRRWEADTDHGDRILAPFLLDEELLYVPAGRHVYAFDPATGDRVWSYRLADEVRVQPAYADGRLFVATASGRILALDLDGV
jgi:outer membrane protein assembly factor BamB